MFPAIGMGEGIPTTELGGLRVVGPGYGLNGTELQAFNQRSGLSLALMVHAPTNKKFVNVDDSKCSLTSLIDDRGHNLLDGVDWGSFPKVSKDGRLALIEVTSKSRPSKSASRIHAKGTIHLCTAGSERTEKIENLKLEVGGKSHIQQNILQVMKVQKENDGLNLVLQGKRTLTETFKAVRFYTSKDHSVDVWGRGSFTFGNTSQMQYNLDLKSVPETLIMEIDLWQDLETLDLPFEIDSGLGL